MYAVTFDDKVRIGTSMIAIKNAFGIVELVTIQEYIAMEVAELERLMAMSSKDGVK